MLGLEALGGDAAVAGGAYGRSVADNGSTTQQLSVKRSRGTATQATVAGGILVGLLELRYGGHAALQLLQGRVYACRHILGLLHNQTMVDQAGKFEVVVAASSAGVV